MTGVARLAERLRAEGRLLLRVKVVPRSARPGIAGFLADGTLKVRLHAPPERGKANAELCDLLARELGVSRQNVTIVSGETSPLKQVRVRP